MHNILAYIAVIAVGTAVTLVANVPARKISLRIGYTATPDERKVHEVTTPYGGGAAMLVGFCVALMVAMAIPTLRNIILASHEMIGVLLAAGVIFVVGVLDDFREMSAPAKVAGQFLAASILYFSGVTMYQLKLPFAGFVVLGPSILPIITAVWVFALSNAVNLIDGLDGLAGGIVAIASGTLCLYGLRLEDLGLLPSNNVGPLIAALTCGICLGFLRDNFHPAKLFMGDAGALMLGLLMSASTMVIGGSHPAGEWRDVLLLRAAVDPRLHPRGAADRRGLGLRAPNRLGAGLSHARQEPHPPPPDATGTRSPAHGGDPLALDGGALRLRVSCRSSTRRRTFSSPSASRSC